MTDSPAHPPAPARLRWATSKQVGGTSELAVMAPIKKGVVPYERRTYEERLRFLIDNLQMRHERGLPNELDRVTAIHFGRMIVIRPEQYLFLATLPTGSDPEPDLARILDEYEEAAAPPPAPPADVATADAGSAAASEAAQQQRPPPRPEFRSWLLTLVEFDGDLKAYMHDIAGFIGPDFDRIFENCEGYPGAADFGKFWIWIRTFQITTDLFYAPYRDISTVRIRQLEIFKRRFDAFVAKVRGPTGSSVASMDELFDGFLRENQQFAEGFPSPSGLYPTEDAR